MRKLFLIQNLTNAGFGFLRAGCQLQTTYPRLRQNIRDSHLESWMERRTPQRDAIRSLFTIEGDPLSPQEIHELASNEVVKLSLATVYRTIRSLEELGDIVAVELPGEPARYELAGKGHHHHFMCQDCGRAFDVDSCPGDLSMMTPSGFNLIRHEITLYGYCIDCVKNRS